MNIIGFILLIKSLVFAIYIHCFDFYLYYLYFTFHFLLYNLHYEFLTLLRNKYLQRSYNKKCLCWKIFVVSFLVTFI
ncbi:hypothetical protein BHY_1232 (plasmid) [Borrelia nietonii YOR]|uniref:Uncharacterized protein n=2 Tax=Borrelia TaxID=138 RepID=W5SBU6_9SPIR|nr:hypothetical protein BHY_1232 [Borrelia nietonii YOR]AHH14458.1 hypothetical protein BHW_0900014 [Borrelia hermsii MTW]